ncbi:MAG: hypothetical protein OEZ43_07700 [Gammaproteobacteria bacterium]|nr:hypothetical protein [Gammaproteobacteria bacterium]
MTKTYKLLLLSVFLFPFNQTQASSLDLSGYLSLALGLGGDRLLEIGYTDGTKGTTYAGNGASVIVGSTLRNNYFETRAGIGFMSVRQTGDNGGAGFRRWVAEGTGLIRLGREKKHMIGGGVVYHIKPVLECEFTGLCQDYTYFKNALGYTVEYNYVFDGGNPNYMDTYAIALLFFTRVQIVKYQINDSTSNYTADGSGISMGVAVTWY